MLYTLQCIYSVYTVYILQCILYTVYSQYSWLRSPIESCSKFNIYNEQVFKFREKWQWILISKKKLVWKVGCFLIGSCFLEVRYVQAHKLNNVSKEPVLIIFISFIISKHSMNPIRTGFFLNRKLPIISLKILDF